MAGREGNQFRLELAEHIAQVIEEVETGDAIDGELAEELIGKLRAIQRKVCKDRAERREQSEVKDA